MGEHRVRVQVRRCRRCRLLRGPALRSAAGSTPPRTGSRTGSRPASQAAPGTRLGHCSGAHVGRDQTGAAQARERFGSSARPERYGKPAVGWRGRIRADRVRGPHRRRGHGGCPVGDHPTCSDWSHPRRRRLHRAEMNADPRGGPEPGRRGRRRRRGSFGVGKAPAGVDRAQSPLGLRPCQPSEVSRAAGARLAAVTTVQRALAG